MHSIFSFSKILHEIENEIKKISFDNYSPQSLFNPIIYIMSLGGKRVRPALAVMGYNLYKDDIAKAMPVALGIEVFHNFTLLHDDLMDKADVRRNQPTVHAKWNDNVAVLSGDAMLIEAYKEICKVEDKNLLPAVLDLFSQTATEICCGQQLDMEFEQRLDVSIEEYLEMIKLKTAVLLGCTLQEGALLASADRADQQLLYDFGINLGMAFQLKDDLLDVYGDPKTFGKNIGGDIVCNKKTFLFINALNDSSTSDEVLEWVGKKGFDKDEKINTFRSIYDRLGLKSRSEDIIDQYYKLAIENLNKVNVPPHCKQTLLGVAQDLMFRNS